MAYAPTRAGNTNTTETNKTLSDPLRVSIVEALGQAEELSAAELAEMFGVNERLMRYHLRRLERAQAIDHFEAGQQVTYTVRSSAIASACHILYGLWVEAATDQRQPTVTL